MPDPQVYRMKLWSTDDTRAKSKFWYFLSRLKKVKKANGQILACNEIFEEDVTTIKNFGIWIRYQSRTGFHNAYKEYREVSMNKAVDALYEEMASRHRVRAPCLQIIKTGKNPALRHIHRTHGVSASALHHVFYPDDPAEESPIYKIRGVETEKQFADLFTKGFTKPLEWSRALANVGLRRPRRGTAIGGS